MTRALEQIIAEKLAADITAGKLEDELQEALTAASGEDKRRLGWLLLGWARQAIDNGMGSL